MKILQDTDVVRGGCTLLHPPLTTLLMQIKKQRPLVASLGIDETKKVFGQFITALSFSSSLLRFRADSEGGERLFIPKRRALDRRFQTGCLQLYPLPPCRVSEPHLKAAEEEKGGRGETNTRDIKSVIHGNSQTSRSQPAALRLALSA